MVVTVDQFARAMKPWVFLITPFSPARAAGEDPATFAAVQEAVAQAAALAGMELRHPAQLLAAGVIMEQVRQAIAEADVVVAIITGENPNVYLEIGTALATAKRPVVLIRDVPGEIPFDIRHHRVLTYGQPGELAALAATLAQALGETFAIAPSGESSGASLDEVRLMLTALVEEWRARSTARVGRAIIDYSEYIADKTAGFTGRQFVFDAIDRFLAGTPAGYLLIRGDPGIGKTTIMAELVRRHAHPHHFNILAEGLTRPAQFLGNACAQLIARHQLDDVRLPDDADLTADVLRKVLTQAAAKAGPNGVVLLVDALDEATAAPGEAAHNPLLLPFSLPAGCRIIATTRRTAQELEIQAETVTPLELIASSDDNLLDVRAHLAAFAQRPGVKRLLDASGWTEADLIETLERKSEGNFMYLRHVLPTLERLEPGADIKLDSAELPQGLRGYYERHWVKMRGEDFGLFVGVYQKIIAVLATARQPVRASLIARASGLSQAEVSWTIEHWLEFLNETPDPAGPLYRIYHASYGDFLAEKTVA